MNKIEINKDNYKGYVELYKRKNKMSDEEYNYETKFLIKVFAVFFANMSIVIITGLFAPVDPIILKNIVLAEIIGTMIVEVGVGVSGIRKLLSLKKEKINQVKEMYPYVDTEVKVNQLGKALEEVNILRRVYKQGAFVENLDVSIYEENLEQDHPKEEIYTRYVIEPADTVIETQEKKSNTNKTKKLVK